jgi:hypothetical protein
MERSLQISILLGICIANIYALEGERWQTPARWHRTLKKSEPGTFLMDQDGIEFRSTKFRRRWKYVDIHTFDLSPHELTLWTYENRPWHEPGERLFRFTLSETMPPELTAQFTARVGKPVQNGAPIPTSAAVEEIPAHHRVWSSGSNGVLRLKEDGIDYIAENGRDSRSWRWKDIETIANPNPYEFRVTAFREIAEFDLKQPLAREVFERLWDRLYATCLNLSTRRRGIGQEVPQ